ncbi:hypothetical protein V8E36_002065, partial [Tilletia maclaganii]
MRISANNDREITTTTITTTTTTDSYSSRVLLYCPTRALSSARPSSTLPAWASCTTPFGVSSTLPVWASSTSPVWVTSTTPSTSGSTPAPTTAGPLCPRPAVRAICPACDLGALLPRHLPAWSSPSFYDPRSSPLCGRSPLRAVLPPFARLLRHLWRPDPRRSPAYPLSAAAQPRPILIWYLTSLLPPPPPQLPAASAPASLFPACDAAALRQTLPQSQQSRSLA